MRGLPSGLLHPHIVNRGNPAIQRDRTKCFGQEKGKAGYFIRAYDARTRRCHRSSGRKGKGSIFKTKMLPVTPEQPQFMLRHKSEMLLERFAFENICRPDPVFRPAGFTPPPEQPQFTCGAQLRRRGFSLAPPDRRRTFQWRNAPRERGRTSGHGHERGTCSTGRRPRCRYILCPDFRTAAASRWECAEGA